MMVATIEISKQKDPTVVQKKFWPIEFKVLDTVSNVLGLYSSTEMKLAQGIETLDHHALRKYADTFSGLGCINDEYKNSSTSLTNLLYTLRAESLPS